MDDQNARRGKVVPTFAAESAPVCDSSKMALTSPPTCHSSRRVVAALFAGGAGLTLLVACSSFGSASPTSPDEGGTEAAAEAGPSADSAALCKGGVRVTESFDGISDSTLFHGWSVNSGNAVGALDIATNDQILSGVTPPYLRVRSTLTGADSMRATIQRIIKIRPSHVTLAFDVALGLGAADFYAEYGCAVFLRKAEQDGTYFNLATSTTDQRLQARAEVDPGAAILGEVNVGTIAAQQARHVVFQIDVDPANNVVFSTTVGGTDGTLTKAPPSFALATEVVEANVECGVIYGSHAGAGAGKLEVAIDNVDLTVCP
jgi:hypothetical protein